MNTNDFSHEYKAQWAKVYERRGNIRRNYVPLVEYWLEGIGLNTKKTRIRHVLHNATYDWIVLILLGKLAGYKVTLPKNMEITDKIKSVMNFTPQPEM